MRFYRNLFILAALLAALIATYIYIPKQDDENASGNTKVVKSIDKDGMMEVELKNQHGRIVLVKDDGQWRMSEPENHKLDRLSIESFIDQLSGIEAEGIVEDNATDLEKYGLKDPESQIAVKTLDGISTEFMLGNETPIDGGYYLKTSDSNTVYKIGSSSAGEFLKSPDEFKERGSTDKDSDKSTGE